MPETMSPETRERESKSSLEIMQDKAAELTTRRQQLEQEEAELDREFMEIFAPAMLEVFNKKEAQLIIKPSRRQGIVRASYPALNRDNPSDICFNDAEGKNVNLEHSKDFVEIDFSLGKHFSPEAFDNSFIKEVFRELEETK